MKNLKKILVGFLVLVLLVSSAVVLVVTAEEEAVQYTGDLAEAQKKFDEVPAIGAAADRCRTKLSFVYAYLRKNPIDPTTEGYKEFKEELDRYTLMLADAYYEQLCNVAKVEKPVIADVQKALGTVISYVVAFEMEPGVPDPDGDDEVYISSEALIKEIDNINYNMMKSFYDSAVAKLDEEALDYNGAMSEIAALYAHSSTYAIFDEEEVEFPAFYLEYNELSVRVSEAVIAYLRGLRAAEDATYYSELEKLLPSLKDNINEKCPVDFDAFPEEKATELKNRFEAFKAAIEEFEIGRLRAYFEEYKKFKDEDSTAKYPELDRASRFFKVYKALSTTSISEDNDEYQAFLELEKEVNEEAEKLAAVKEERRKALEASTPLSEYEMMNNYSYRSFESESESMGNPNADASEYSERVTEEDGNAYWRYVVLGSPQANYSYASITQPNITNGFVVSFDFMAEGTNGTHYNVATFTNEWTNSVGTRLVNYGKSIFEIAYDKETDSIKVYNAVRGNITEQTVVTNIAAEGQWFNVTFTYDPVTHHGKFYIDYEYMFDIYIYGWVEGATRTIFRISHQTAWQNSCYDNITFYEGTYYRNPERFNTDEITDAEKAEMFKFCVDQFTSDAVDSKSADFAYRQAKSMLNDIKAYVESGQMTEEAGDALKEKIKALEDYDYEGKILNGVKAQNLAEILSQVDALEAIEVTTANVSKINTAIAALDKFVEENSELVDKTNKSYNEALKRADAVKLSLSRLDNVKALAKALTQFTRTTTLASMTRRYAVAEEIYKNAKYDNDNYRALVENDPLFLEFEALINGALTQDDPAYITWNDYYLSIPAKLKKQEKYENSDKIITCIELLLELEGYENTEEYWAAHNDEVDFYITIIRNIVVAENYDASYPGINEALAQYELVDEYFNKLLQEKHVAIIGAQLESFLESEYIEKVGICTYLDKYFENNPDIDKSNPVIQEYMYKLERYKAELEGSQEKDYILRLEENTKQFISIVGSMSAFSTYAELKPIYDNALSYYYLMNVDSDEAKAAIALFEGYGDALKTIEINSALFVESSKNLNIIDRLGVTVEYSVLSDLSKFYPYLDATYSDEVKTLMLRYDGLLKDYNDAVISANNAADTASEISSSLRSNQISVTILAVVNQLYKAQGGK